MSGSSSLDYKALFLKAEDEMRQEPELRREAEERERQERERNQPMMSENDSEAVRGDISGLQWLIIMHHQEIVPLHNQLFPVDLERHCRWMCPFCRTSASHASPLNKPVCA